MTKEGYGPLLGEMTWEEVRDAAAEGYCVIIVVGSTEQHGPHLPIQTDALLGLDIAKGVAERTRSVVAPPLVYGYKSKPLSGGGQGFPGTTSLRGATLTAVVQDVVSELIRSGFRNMLVMLSHMENSGFTYEGIDLAVREANNPDVRVISMDSTAGDADMERVLAMFPGDFPGWDVEHAALTETSMMLALHPNLVREDRIADDQAERHPPYDMIPAPMDTIPASGVLYKATLGTKEKGWELYEIFVESVATAIRREFGG